MKAYKGFNKDMTCRGFQYKKGGKYEADEVEICECGFHACENPLDCFVYYRPDNGSVFHEVELGGRIKRSNDDTKCAATTIKIGARLTLAGMIKAGLDFVFAKVKNATAAKSGICSRAATSGCVLTAAASGGRSRAATYGDCSTAATSGYVSTAATLGCRSTAATSGYRSTAITSGNRSTAATSGHVSTAATLGCRSTAITSGDYSTAITSGDRSPSITSGDYSTAIASGNRSTAATSGYRSTAEVRGTKSVAVVTGVDSKARGGLGCWLVLTERDSDWNILGVQAIRIDGENYKPGTWYELQNGKVVEAGVGEE